MDLQTFKTPTRMMRERQDVFHFIALRSALII
jgi:hypothetical protein